MSDISSYIDNIRMSYIDFLDIPKKYKKDLLTSTEWNDTVAKINEIREYLNDNENNNTQNFVDALRTLDNTASADALHALEERLNEQIANIHQSLFASQISMSPTDPSYISSKIQDIYDRINNIQRLTGADIPVSTSDDMPISYRISLLSKQIGDIGNSVTQYDDRITDVTTYSYEVGGKVELLNSHINDIENGYDRLDTYTNQLGNNIDNINTYTNQLGNNIDNINTYTNQLGNNIDNINTYTNQLGNNIDILNDNVTNLGDTVNNLNDNYDELNTYTRINIGTTRDELGRLRTYVDDTTLTFDYDVNSSTNENKRIYDSHKDLYGDDYHE